METLKLKKIKYGKHCPVFSLNKLNFQWKELKIFPDLEECLERNKFQTNYHTKSSFNKPSYLEKNETTFSAPEILYGEKPFLVMNICLPCYDEEWCEISGTLRSLSKNILIHRNRPDNSFQLHVNIFIIQDGWGKASKSFKEGIHREWACPPKETIDKILQKDQALIIVPEVEVFYPVYQNSKDGSGVIFNPIFITKKTNSQKHNSHLFFFSLCYLQNPNVVFLTDCGTIFNSDCLFQLSEYLFKKHSSVIGVTAKQSVMNETTRQQIQEYPSWWKEKKRDSFCTRFMKHIYWWFSPAPLQGFEFESSFLLNTSMFNIAGALPVLPGPCQMLWWPYLLKESENGVLDTYFKHINDSMKDINSNILRVNTVLAEDRILSFSMILRTFELKTVWVNKATFSYEPMMSWVKLLGQRRRWINGTISTFLYYLIDSKGKDEYLMSGLGNRNSIKYLWIIQLYQSLLQILSPSFFSIAVYESFLQFFKTFPFLRTYFQLFEFKTPIYTFSQEMVFTSMYLAFYVLWVLISLILGKKSPCCNKSCYSFIMESIYLLFSFVNAIVSTFIFFNIFDANNRLVMFGPLIYILMFIWIVPFFLSLSLSFESAFYYIMYSLPFFVNIAQYVSFVPTFAFSRLHDLSWGNRDSETNVSRKKKMSFLCTTIKLNILVIMLNILIAGFYIFLISKFGHNEYVYTIFFLVLFLSVIIQILFTITYFCKIIFKGCRREMCGSSPKKDDELEFSIAAKTKSTASSSAII
jgi:cellulose synthase/poly-beta-1,6-N-acetylglucosamine synthase-like glycosyltransferase